MIARSAVKRALAILVALCALGPSGAEARRRRPKLLILLLEAEDVPNNVALAVNAAVRDEAGSKTLNLELLPPPAMDFTSMQLAAACVDDGAKCLGGIGRTLGASKVMRIQLKGPPRKATFRVTVVDVRRKKSKIEDALLEDLGAESLPHVRWVVSKALGGKPPPLTGALALVIGGDEGSLDGAEILLDDKSITEASLAAIPPGRHRLEVRQKGYESFIWMGNVRPGSETLVTVKFKSKLSVPPPPPEVTPPISKAPPPPPPVKSQPGQSGQPGGPKVGVSPPPSTTITQDVQKPRLFKTWFLLGAGVASLAAAFPFVVIGKNANDRLNEINSDNPGLYNFCATSDSPMTQCEDIRGDRRTVLIASVGNISAFALAGVFGALTVWQFFAEDGPLLFSASPTADGGQASMRLRF